MALTDDFSYVLGDDGIVLNPDSLVPPFVDLTEVDGLDNAPYRQTERDHEGTEGSFMDAVYERGRNIILQGTIYSSDGNELETFLDQLKSNWAPSRTLVPFYFKKPGVPERFVRVKPLGVRYRTDQLRRLGTVSAQFLAFAEDPRIYSSSLRSYDIVQAPVVFTGRAYPREYSYGYGDPVTSSAVNVFVDGNRPTPALFTITGPTSYPRIVNETLGKELLFNLVVSAGSTLVVDTYYHTVKLDGENRRATLSSPTWFNLAPGNNYIRYFSTTAGSSVLNVQCYDAWR